MNTMINTLNQELNALITNAHRSLVQITNGRHGVGAGTIWHPDGLIVTNAHVVAGRRGYHPSLTVTLWDGRSFPARLLAADEALDLAALAVEANGLPTIEPGDSRALHVGQWVTAVGHPWGIRGAAAAGTIIDTGVPVEWNGAGREMIQVGIQLRPGHSGGPMLDENGRLVGINTMISGPLVGLAIPVHVVKGFLKEKLGSK